MPIEPDWTKIAGIILGAIGSILGFYNLLVAQHERRQKVKIDYAITLMSLDPIIKQVLSLPLSQPKELASIDRKVLAKKLEDIEQLVNESKEKLVVLLPELAPHVLNLQQASKALLKQLSAHTVNSSPANYISETYDYLNAAWKLSLYRGCSPAFGMKLYDQGEPSVQNLLGDNSIFLLKERMEVFRQATRQLTRHSTGSRK